MTETATSMRLWAVAERASSPAATRSAAAAAWIETARHSIRGDSGDFVGHACSPRESDFRGFSMIYSLKAVHIRHYNVRTSVHLQQSTFRKPRAAQKLTRQAASSRENKKHDGGSEQRHGRWQRARSAHGHTLRPGLADVAQNRAGEN